MTATRAEVREHGTNRGYWQHYRRGEAACDPCRSANREYNRNLRAKNIEQRLEAERLRGARRRANPDDPIHASKRRARDKLQKETAAFAERSGQPFSAEEDVLVLQDDLPVREIALSLQRTAASVANRRRWLRTEAQRQAVASERRADVERRKRERQERKQAEAAKRRLRPKKTHTFSCEVCGKEASSTRRDAKYCSASCNTRAYVDRNRDKQGCSVDKCEAGGPFVRGMCRRHYGYWRVHGQPLFVVAREHGTIAGYWQHFRRRDTEEPCEACVVAQREYSNALYNSDPQRYRNHVHREYQRPTLDSAHKNGNVWTGPEMELLLRDDLTNRELAKVLGRTFFAVSTRRSQIRREYRDHGDTKWVRLAGTPRRSTSRNL